MKNVHDRHGVAEMMGHASDETAGLHYGKKISGHRAFRDAAAAHREYQNDRPNDGLTENPFNKKPRTKFR